MFIEPLESRTLLSGQSFSAADTTPSSPATVNLSINTPKSFQISGLFRHLLFDPTRSQLIAIGTNQINRYDAADGALIASLPVGDSLGDGDITSDGKFLYVAEQNSPHVYKVNLTDNTFTALNSPPPLATGIGYALQDIAIAANKALTSESFSSFSGVLCCAFIRQIDLTSDAFTYATFSNYGNLALSQTAMLARSADYSYTAILSPIHDFRVFNNTLAGSSDHQYGNLTSIAVSRDGSVHAVAGDEGIQIVNSSFQPVTSLGVPRASVDFDPHADILYAASADTDLITAFDTNTWSPLFSIPIDQPITTASDLVVSDDGQELFLATDSGIRIYHPNGAVGVFAEDVTFTAAVADPASAGTPSGLVSFIDASTNTPLGEASIVDGQAVLTTDDLHAGQYSIIAHYEGDDVFLPADSQTSSLTINRAFVTASISSLDDGQLRVDLHSAVVSPTQGTLTLYDGDTAIGKAQLSAEFALFPALAPGIHQLHVVYSGNSDFLPTISPRIRYIVRMPTTLTLSGSSDMIRPTEMYPLTIQLSPSPLLTTVVKIYRDGEQIGTANVSTSGVAQTSFAALSPGTYHFTARFEGDENLKPSVSNEVIQTVQLAPATITLSSPLTVIQDNQVLKATVQSQMSSALPQGHVIFKENAVQLADLPLLNDATAFYTGLPIGRHTVTATYVSWNGFSDATSQPFTFEVVPNPTHITLTTPFRWVPEQFVHFDARVEFTPTKAPDFGHILFKEGIRTVGSATINRGNVSANLRLPAGNHNITAYFAGLGTFGPSTSQPLKITTVAAPTVDLMVLYTLNLKQMMARGDIPRTTITDAVSGTNLALWNSHIPLAIRLVNTTQVFYNESGKFKTDLQRLTRPHDGFMDSIHALRNKVGADLVSLFVGDGDLGGLGWELRDVRDPTNADYAFSVVLAGQAAAPYYTLAHELGHNFGATHDAQHSDGKGATSFSAGWRFRGSDGVLYHDIMSYDPGETIPYFSNPRIRYQGVPTGDARTADSARTIAMIAPYVAAYRKHKA